MNELALFAVGITSVMLIATGAFISAYAQDVQEPPARLIVTHRVAVEGYGTCTFAMVDGISDSLTIVGCTGASA